MNKEKRSRLRCVNCIFYSHDAKRRGQCEQNPNYILDRNTRRPDWCPLRKRGHEVTDDQLKWINKEFVVPAVPTESSTDIQVNINDFIPQSCKGGAEDG